MPFRITVDEGNDKKEYKVYDAREVRQFQNRHVTRTVDRLVEGSIGAVTGDLQDAQDDIDELNNVKLPDLDSRLDTQESKMSDLESSLSDLNTSLTDLNNYLSNIETDIDNLQTDLNTVDSKTDTLDGYFNDPSTIPSSYNFFSGIVAEQAWIDALVANQAWLDNLFVNDAYADRITANEIAAGTVTATEINAGTITANEIASSTITSNEINVSELIASTVWANEFIANEGYVDELIANDVFANKITANEISVSQLSAITASMGALTVDDVLTIGAGGSLQGSNWLINEDTWTHPTLGGVVWSLANKATFSTGDSVSSLDNGEWSESITALDGATETTQNVKQKIQYVAKEGIDEISVTGFVRRERSGTGSGYASMIISINGQTAESQQVASSLANEVSATISNLTLTTGTTYVIDIILKASSTADSGQAVEHTTDGFLRDDIVINEGVS